MQRASVLTVLLSVILVNPSHSVSLNEFAQASSVLDGALDVYGPLAGGVDNCKLNGRIATQDCRQTYSSWGFWEAGERNREAFCNDE
jgi:hypothetical protein